VWLQQSIEMTLERAARHNKVTRPLVDSDYATP